MKLLSRCMHKDMFLREMETHINNNQKYIEYKFEDMMNGEYKLTLYLEKDTPRDLENLKEDLSKYLSKYFPELFI